MNSENRQAQALVLVQSFLQWLKTPLAQSVLQCAAMGALAFLIMLLGYRYSFGSPLFDLAGVFIAIVLGGVAGAIVRYYFVKVEEERGDGPRTEDVPRPDAAPPDSTSEEAPAVVEELKSLDLEPAVSEASQDAEGPAIAVSPVEPPVAEPEREAEPEPVPEPELEPEPEDTAKQIVLFPWLPEEEEPEEPIVHLPVPEPVVSAVGPEPVPTHMMPELALPEEPEEPEVHDAISPTQRQLLSWMQEHARVFCVMVNAEDEIVYANDCLMTSLGYSWEELSANGFTATVVPPRLRRDAWTDFMHSFDEAADSFVISSYLWTRDGREIPAEWYGSAIFDDADELTCCCLMGLDVTERKHQEEESAEDLQHYQTRCLETNNELSRVQSILDSSVEAMAVFDLHGKASYVNPAFTELFGWTAEELQDQDSPFVPASQRELEKPFLDGLREKGTPCKNLDTKRLCKDGSLVSARMTLSLIRDRQGQASGILCTLRALVEKAKAVKEPVKPALQLQPKKRQVNAREVAGDILSGMTDAQLMEKYKLTAKGLHSVFQKLIAAKVIKPSQIVRRSLAYDETVAIELSRIIPLEKPAAAAPPPAPKPKATKLPEPPKPPKPTAPTAAASPIIPPQPAAPAPPSPPMSTEVHGLTKFGLSEESLDDLVKDLLPGKSTHVKPPAEQDASLNTQDLEDVTARRAMPRNYMVVSVPIYESDNLLAEGTIIDINEQGLKIQGINTRKGDIKSLLIQGDEYHDVFPFVFDAECRWATKDDATGDTVAGFQITAISDTSIEELRKLIAALSISA